jgi:hypothetical protein
VTPELRDIVRSLASLVPRMVGRPVSADDHSMATIQISDLCRLADAVLAFVPPGDAKAPEDFTIRQGVADPGRFTLCSYGAPPRRLEPGRAGAAAQAEGRVTVDFQIAQVAFWPLSSPAASWHFRPDQFARCACGASIVESDAKVRLAFREDSPDWAPPWTRCQPCWDAREAWLSQAKALGRPLDEPPIVDRPSPTPRPDAEAVDRTAVCEAEPFAWVTANPDGTTQHVFWEEDENQDHAEGLARYIGGYAFAVHRPIDLAIARAVASLPEVKGPAVHGAPTDEEIAAEFDAWRARNERRRGDGVIVAGAGGCRAIPWAEIDAACGRVRADLESALADRDARIAALEAALADPALQPPWLPDLLAIFGWQGGTYTQALAEVRRLKRIPARIEAIAEHLEADDPRGGPAEYAKRLRAALAATKEPTP